MKTTLLIPTLNEIDGMRAVMPRIKREWVDEIVVVDGGSTDGTVAYARDNGYLVVEQKLKGLVNAYREAMPYVHGDIVVTFTPDGNSVPEKIPPLVEKMKEGYDMVIVSRYLDGAKSYDDDAVTALGNWMFTRMINVLFGAHYTDTLVGFRAWKKDLLTLADKDPELPSFEPFSAIKCAQLKLRASEIPGDEPKRIGGERKMQPLRNGWQVLMIIVRAFLGRHK